MRPTVVVWERYQPIYATWIIRGYVLGGQLEEIFSGLTLVGWDYTIPRCVLASGTHDYRVRAYTIGTGFGDPSETIELTYTAP